MKRVTLLLAFFLSTSTTLLAQTENCGNTCIVDKTIYEDVYLGVIFGSPCDREIERGVIILKVLPNTPAEKNNMKPYDVVLAINGNNINRRGDIINTIRSFKPFDDVEFTIYRDGKTLSKTVVLGAKTTKIIQEKVCCIDATLMFSEDNISVYPIPAKTHLNITFKALLRDSYHFGIYMANGRLIKEYDKVLDEGNLEETIPVNKLQDGVYVLKISNHQETFTRLFIVSRK